MSYDSIKQRDREIFERHTKPDPFHSSTIAKEMYEILQAWMAKWIISHPDYSQGLRCLDIGCGSGVNSEWLGSLARTIVGLDHTKKRVKFSSARLSDREKFNFIVADGENPPFKNQITDVIFCSAILHHLPNYRSALALYKQCLNKAGLMVSSEPCAYNPFVVVRRKFFPSETHTPDERPFPPREIIEEFRKMYDFVAYKRFYLLSVNAPLVEKVFGLKTAKLYFRMFSAIDNILLKIPIIKELCWLICLIGYNKNETKNVN